MIYTSKKRRHKKIKPQKVNEAPILLQAWQKLSLQCAHHVYLKNAQDLQESSHLFSASHSCPQFCTVNEQVTVNGILYGGWGRDKYGTKPIKLEALEVCDG